MNSTPKYNSQTICRLFDYCERWCNHVVMSVKTKTAKQMERHFKGVANHHRIEILLLVESSPGITMWDIADALRANRKTISQHTRYLVQAGLVAKRYRGRNVEHTLSPYGRIFTRFVKYFQKTPGKIS